jgi:hypothetical protein
MWKVPLPVRWTPGRNKRLEPPGHLNSSDVESTGRGAYFGSFDIAEPNRPGTNSPPLAFLEGPLIFALYNALWISCAAQPSSMDVRVQPWLQRLRGRNACLPASSAC